jgi:hypothetical protein
MAARRNQTPKEACLTAFPAMIRPVQLLPHKRSGARTSGEGALSDFAAYFESLRRTSQSECELPHILRPSAALFIDEKEFVRPFYATNVIVSTIPSDSRESGLSFRMSRGTVGAACSEHSERRPQPGLGAVNGAPAHSTGRSVQPNGASLTRLSPRNERGEEFRAQTGRGRCMVQS